jgi:hypothetical protein
MKAIRTTIIAAAAAATAATVALPPAMGAMHAPRTLLVGRAVLPAQTYAPGPVSGTFFGSVVTNGVTFPLPSQPVEGFSSIVAGRSPGEYLAMPDNGFGNKKNSFDFLIRAYYIRPDFTTEHGGNGSVKVGGYVSFRDPLHRFGFPIQNEHTQRRLLTGADIDPESLQRDKAGDLWVGDEFGPWILRFSPSGVLLHAPYRIPGVRSPDNPALIDPLNATQPSSRGFEAMAITPNGRYLYAVLEGAHTADPDQSRRYVYEFDVRARALTGRTWQYHTAQPGYLVSDMAAVSSHRLVLIQRDAGRGLSALFRDVEVIDLHAVGSDGFLVPRPVVDLTAIPDPNLISLPPVHAGDVGLGDPYRVTCESVEALHVVNHSTLLIGCDNNFPNTGRNPALADDTELILVHVAGLTRRCDR